MTIIRRTPEEYLEQINRSQRGKMKLYIGCAPGVGKTYKMLLDAHEMKKEGHDVVIGFIETHGRNDTESVIGDLEQVPLLEIHYKEKQFCEVNVREIIKRRPAIVLIDELAHTNAPSSKYKKRFQDVEELLENGINVWAAVNIQHIESVHDIVEKITGIKVRERIPDYILQEASEVQLIDVTPEMLQKRLVDGKIYKQSKITQSLQNFFTLNNLGALRELVLREIADDVDSKLEMTPKIKERILVCVQYGVTGNRLIRRGWRLASRMNAELFILNIQKNGRQQFTVETEKVIKQWEQLAKQFDATFLLKDNTKCSPAEMIIQVANELKITQIVMGVSARSRWEEIMKGSIVNTIMRHTKNIDIHIVGDDR